jgi:TolA-binding protein
MPGRGPRGHRLTRGELKEDKFVDEVLRVVRFVDRRRREVGAVAAAVVVGVAAVLVMQARARSTEEEAARLLAESEIALSTGNQDEAVSGYRYLVEAFAGARAGREAGVYLGQLLLEQGDVDGARAAFQFCLDRPPSKLLRIAAESGLAASQEEQGDVEAAAGAYEELAARYEDTYAGPEMLLRAGRCRQRLGEWSAAVSLFSALVEKYPESTLLPTARFELAYSRTREEQQGT